MVRDLRALAERLDEQSPEHLAARVVRLRRRVWWNFTVDTWERTSKKATRLESELAEMLGGDVSLDDTRNTWELRVWRDLLAERKTQRGSRGSLKWWSAAIAEVNSFLAAPAYSGPTLPALRAELQADVDRATTDPESETSRFRALLDDRRQ